MNLLCTACVILHRFTVRFIFFSFLFFRLSHGKRESTVHEPHCSLCWISNEVYTGESTKWERERDARYLSHPRRIVEPSTERGVGRTMPSCVTTPGRLPVNAATWRIIIVVCTSFSCPSLGTLIFFGLNWCADNCAWVPRNGRSFSREIVAWLIPFYTYRWKGRWRWIRKHARTRVQWGWRLIRCQWAAQSAIMYSFWRDPVPFVVRRRKTDEFRMRLMFNRIYRVGIYLCPSESTLKFKRKLGVVKLLV